MSEALSVRLTLRPDCRHYRGDRPCRAGVPRACPATCAEYEAVGPRILLIKLGALGDVVRTAALLPGLKAAWPDCQVTWVTRRAGVRILANHPLIERLLPFDAETLCHLEHEQFELCLSLDKEPGPAALAMRVRASERRGIGLSRFGKPAPLNAACEPYFELGLDDELKFRRNRKSYPELIYGAVGLPYAGQGYQLYPGPAERARARALWERLGVGDDEPVVGLNTGAGAAFANKSWRPARFAALGRQLAARGVRAALLGGPAERARNIRLAAQCPELLDAGCNHSELEFAALVQRCAALVTGDTLALHVAIGVGTPCIALFGPTCPQEIDFFGRGEHVVTSLPCAPCYRRECERAPNCMDDIGVERVLGALERTGGSRLLRTPDAARAPGAAMLLEAGG
ncbi:MAG: glycosyltransferase family 9 protein [Planctomycetota bacterium]